jgi:hypothetical protein
MAVPTGFTGLVHWDNQAPVAKTARVDILSPKAQSKVHAISLSARPCGVWVHFFDGRSHPCLQSKLTCEGCRRLEGKRWKCYLAAINPVNNEYAILEITEGAYHKCPQLANEQYNLRGALITLIRRSINPKGPVICTVDPRPSSSKLPPEFNLAEALENVWTKGRGAITGPIAAPPPADSQPEDPSYH